MALLYPCNHISQCKLELVLARWASLWSPSVTILISSSHLFRHSSCPCHLLSPYPCPLSVNSTSPTGPISSPIFLKKPSPIIYVFLSVFSSWFPLSKHMFALECNLKFFSLNYKSNTLLHVKILYRIFKSEKITPGFPIPVHRRNHCYLSLQSYFCA